MQFIPIDSGAIITQNERNLFISSVSVVANNAARDALVVQTGDVAKVTADNKTYIYDGAAWIPTKDGIDASIYYTKTQVDSAVALKEATANFLGVSIEKVDGALKELLEEGNLLSEIINERNFVFLKSKSVLVFCSSSCECFCFWSISPSHKFSSGIF